MRELPYPILETRTLPPVPRQRFRTARRDLSELPQPRPGTTLVFVVNGRYQEVQGGRHFRGDEEMVVDAVNVSVVDMARERQVPVNVELPSVRLADSFIAQVRFACTVTDAVAVVRAGLTDPSALLSTFISPQIRSVAYDFEVGQINEVRDHVTARVTAACTVKPPHIEGMTVTLADVEVLTPEKLRDYELKKQELLWAQELEALKDRFTRREAEWIEQIMARGPEAVEALAVKLGQVSVASVASRQYDKQDDRDRRLRDLLGLLAEHGHVDRVPVDTSYLIERLVDSLTGSAKPLPGARETPLGGHTNPAITRGDVDQVEDPIDEDET